MFTSITTRLITGWTDRSTGKFTTERNQEHFNQPDSFHLLSIHIIGYKPMSTNEGLSALLLTTLMEPPLPALGTSASTHIATFQNRIAWLVAILQKRFPIQRVH